MHAHENQGVEVRLLPLTITSRASFAEFFPYLLTVLFSTGLQVQVPRRKFFQLGTKRVFPLTYPKCAQAIWGSSL